jgi:hypothetical protein
VKRIFFFVAEDDYLNETFSNSNKRAEILTSETTEIEVDEDFQNKFLRSKIYNEKSTNKNIKKSK